MRFEPDVNEEAGLGQKHGGAGDFLRRCRAAGRVARQRALIELRVILLDHVPDAAPGQDPVTLRYNWLRQIGTRQRQRQ
jgi:hypothetical protein